MIRPVDGLCVLIPVLYSKGQPYFGRTIRFIHEHWLKIAAAGMCFLLPIIPQLLYWKWLTGYWVYDSYGPGQGFDFRHPAIRDGLFGASNGWLFYTPLMIAALAGLTLQRRLMGFGVAAVVVLALYIWAVYSWFLPNYINGFGSRPMLDVYAILAIPLAALLEWLSARRILTRAIAASCLLFFVAWNLSASVQQSEGILISQDSKYQYNFRTAFRYRLRYEDLVIWDIGIPQPERGTLIPGCLYAGINLRDSVFQDHVSDSAGIRRFMVRAGEEYTPLRVRKGSDVPGGTAWIGCYAKVGVTEPVDDIYQQQMLVLQIRRNDSTRHWYGVRINNKIGWFEGKIPAGGFRLAGSQGFTQGAVSYFVPVPADLLPDDELQLDIWNISRKPMSIMDLQLQCIHARK